MNWLSVEVCLQFSEGTEKQCLMENQRMPSKDHEEILFHLGYEWWMFRAAHDLLKNWGEEGPVRNALVESLAIHGRGLVDFFYKEEHEKKEKGRKDDWRVTDLDLALTSPCPPVLSKWKEDVNKRVAHLTECRKNALLTEWKAKEVREELQRRIYEVKKKIGDNMPTGWTGDRQTGSGVIGSSSLGVPTGAVGVTGIGGSIPARSGSSGCLGPTGPAWKPPTM